MYMDKDHAHSRAIAEKRRILREEYGGMLTLQQLTRELGYSCPKAARAWVRNHALEGVKMGTTVRYETDVVAKVIVDSRGMT